MHTCITIIEDGIWIGHGPWDVGSRRIVECAAVFAAMHDDEDRAHLYHQLDNAIYEAIAIGACEIACNVHGHTYRIDLSSGGDENESDAA